MILLVSRVFPPRTGGIENYVYNAYSRLRDVIVITPEYDGSKRFDKNQTIDIRRVAIKPKFLQAGKLPLIPLFFAALKHGLRDNLKQIHCDQVQSGLVGYLLNKLLGKPYTVCTYGMEITGGGSQRLKSLVLRKASQIITISQFTKESLIKKLKVPEEKICLIPPGTDVNHFQPGIDYQQVVEKYHLEGKRVILSVGRLNRDSRYKNFDSVIRIMPRILKKVPNAVYLIVGSGDDLEHLQDIAAQMGVSSRVIFAGQVSYADLPKFYNACQVFVMVSKDETAEGKTSGEGFGIVYLEANACGKPVIAGEAGGAREAAVDGYTGLLVSPDNSEEIVNAVVKLLTNPQLAKKLGEQGRKRVVDNFSWEMAAIKLRSVCRL
jgi:phosphatidylinositol alpha-1,6-mannosyltransferase